MARLAGRSALLCIDAGGSSGQAAKLSGDGWAASGSGKGGGGGGISPSASSAVRFE